MSNPNALVPNDSDPLDVEALLETLHLDDIRPLIAAAFGPWGPTFRKLWYGNDDDIGSAEQADLALARMLISLVGPRRHFVDRLFRSSPRFSPTWDASTGTNRPPTTYGHTTLETAISHATSSMTTLFSDAIQIRWFFAVDAAGSLYVYREGTYQPGGEQHVKGLFKEVATDWDLTNKWSTKSANEIVEYIKTGAPKLWDCPPLDKVHVQNGILDVATRELRPHDPGFLSTVRLPVAYDAKAECPALEQFVRDVFPEDSHDIAWELPAWLMLPDTSVDISVLFHGEGANGKSVYLEALQTFLGLANVTHISLHDLGSNRFAVARLMDKLANICPDLPLRRISDTSMFKAIVSGDRVTAEMKYRSSFEFTPFARLIFSTNTPPASDDSSAGYFRRWRVIPFDRTFQGDDARPRDELVASLTTPTELSGLLNKALDALPNIRTSGLNDSASMQRASAEFQATADPVAAWLDQNTDEDADACTPKQDLFAAYSRHCDRRRVARPTIKAFGMAVKRARPGIAEGRKSIDDKRQETWKGLRLRPVEIPLIG